MFKPCYAYSNTVYLVTYCYLLSVTEKRCASEIPQCTETGGTCVFDSTKVIRCLCPTSTKYVYHVGCRSKLLHRLSGIIKRRTSHSDNLCGFT